jgi:hypothetical protein
MKRNPKSQIENPNVSLQIELVVLLLRFIDCHTKTHSKTHY